MTGDFANSVHSIEEYVRGDAYTQTVDNYFSLLKRDIIGDYHHLSATHLKRYVGEFDFRYNTHKITDMERATLAAEALRVSG